MDMTTDQEALFPDGKFRMNSAEALKYAARLRDEWTVLNPLPPFKQWLAERIFDAEDRLKFAAMYMVVPEMMKLKKTYKDIVYVDARAGESYGDLVWEFSTKCCPSEKPCPTHAEVPNLWRA